MQKPSIKSYRRNKQSSQNYQSVSGNNFYSKNESHQGLKNNGYQEKKNQSLQNGPLQSNFHSIYDQPEILKDVDKVDQIYDKLKNDFDSFQIQQQELYQKIREKKAKQNQEKNNTKYSSNIQRNQQNSISMNSFSQHDQSTNYKKDQIKQKAFQKRNQKSQQKREQRNSLANDSMRIENKHQYRQGNQETDFKQNQDQIREDSKFMKQMKEKSHNYEQSNQFKNKKNESKQDYVKMNQQQRREEREQMKKNFSYQNLKEQNEIQIQKPKIESTVQNNGQEQGISYQVYKEHQKEIQSNSRIVNNESYYVQEMRGAVKAYQMNKKLTLTQEKIIDHMKESFQKIQTLKKLKVENVDSVLPFKIDLKMVQHKCKEKRYLFLDLDETLIFTSRNKIHSHSIQLQAPCVGYVTLRPFVSQFLQEASQYFNIILYTASETNYADQILKMIDPNNEFFIIKLYRQNCVFIQAGIFIKVMGFLENLKIKKSIFVDNSAYHLYDDLKNGIPIIPFHGEQDDKELAKLLVFLKQIKGKGSYLPILEQSFNLELYREEDNFEEFLEKIIKKD